MRQPLIVLGEFAESLEWEAIPELTRTRAQLTLRDTVGTILGGASTPAGRIASATTKATGGTNGGNGASGPMAAFALAVHASALDFDDGHYRGGAIHPGSVIVPALIVALKTTEADLSAFLTAQIVGYEIGLRAAHLLWPRHELDDYHCTGTAATLGAAAAVAKLRGGDAETIARAIGIAWAHAPMATFQLPMVKESIGWSGATALFAADLARAGFMSMPAGVTSAVDATFTPTPFHRDGALDDPFVASLGAVYEATNTYFKPYACCRYTHTAIRSLQDVMTKNNLRAEHVSTVTVDTHHAAMNLSDQQPATLDHAQYSFPFVLAAVMCTGEAGADEICESALTDKTRLLHAAKVSVRHDPDLDSHYPAHYGSRIVVDTTDGSRFDQTRLIAPGDEGDPLTVDDLTAKFVRLAERVHGRTAAIELASAFLDHRWLRMPSGLTALASATSAVAPTWRDARLLIAQALPDLSPT